MFRKSLLLLVVFLVGLQVSFSQTKSRPTLYTVSAGTVMRVRMDQTISSKSARAGDRFKTTLVDPVYSKGGVILIPGGSTVNGRVKNVTKAGKDGEPGAIDVSFTSITRPDRSSFAIVGMLTELDADKSTDDEEGAVKGKKTAHRRVKFIGGGAVGGAILGALIGGGKGALVGGAVGAGTGTIGKLASKGREAEVNKGTEFSVYLSKAIRLPRYRR